MATSTVGGSPRLAWVPEGPAGIESISSSSCEGCETYQKPRLSCKPCRARKVKCDRVEPSCAPCTRLGLPCSYGNGLDPILTTDVRDPSDMTQAGTKRRRTRRACVTCRLMKSKCTGGDPCERCLARGVRCERRSDGNSFQIQSSAQFANSSTPPTILNLNLLSDARTLLSDKPTVRRYIEAYFDLSGAATCVFLLKPLVLADLARETLDPVILKVLVASGLHLCDDRPHSQAIVGTMMQEAQRDILSRLGRLSINQLQALVLIMRYHVAAGKLPEAWMMISLAARVAFIMRLNLEDGNLNPIAQESRRRLVWAIYLSDRQISGGVDDLAVCPTDKIHIRLPCDDHSFRRGIASRAQYLEEKHRQDDGHMSIIAYYIRLSNFRDRILR